MLFTVKSHPKTTVTVSATSQKGCVALWEQSIAPTSSFTHLNFGFTETRM